MVESETILEICNKIKESVDLKFKGHWDCNASFGNVGYYYSLRSGHSVTIKFGKLSINVYRDSRVSISSIPISKFS
jgi:hypothetical protein